MLCIQKLQLKPVSHDVSTDEDVSMFKASSPIAYPQGAGRIKLNNRGEEKENRIFEALHGSLMSDDRHSCSRSALHICSVMARPLVW